MPETVPALSIGGMIFTLCVSVLLPLVLLFVCRKKTGASFKSFFAGAFTFILFALILEQLLHMVVLSLFGEGITGNLLLYAVYGGLAAALFEETGRFLFMKLFLKNRLNRENALMFGIGHGGAESVLIIGITYISNLALSFIVNSGGLDSLLTGVEEGMRNDAFASLAALWSTPSQQFFLAGIERGFSLVLQICLTYLVYRAVRLRRPVFYLLAMAIHFAVDTGTILMADFLPLPAVEGFIALIALCLAVFTVRLYRSEEI